MNRLLLAGLLALTVTRPAWAELYLEAALEGGGDTLARSSLDDEVNAGGGMKLAIGMQAWMDEAGTGSMRFSVGYQWDDVSGGNGSAEIETLTFDAVYLINSGPHSFGIGAVWHASPRYSAMVNGARSTIDFDDAVGPVLQYGYRLSPGLELGLRFSDLEYESAGQVLDAGSFGVYLSNGF
jgi:hypothetical protein